MCHALSSVCLTWPRVCGTGSPGPSSGPRACALSPSVAVCLLCWIGEAAHLKECIKSSHLAALLRFRVCAQDLQVSRAHARLRAERVCRMCMAGPGGPQHFLLECEASADLRAQHGFHAGDMHEAMAETNVGHLCICMPPCARAVNAWLCADAQDGRGDFAAD